MSFFYDLNNKLNAIRELPSTTHGQLNERDMSRAAKGYEKYGKEGMEALAKAGREGKALDPVRAKYDKYDEGVEEGMGDMARKVGGAVKKIGGAVLDKVGHGSDADMIRDLQKKMGMPQTGMKPGAEPNPKQIKEKMSPAKAKSFAALAEPKDKITFADKIAGAKKEVDEMLGDVAAEAMKNALGGHSTKSLKAASSKDVDADRKSGVSPQYSTQQVKGELKRRGEQVASEEEDLNPFTNYKKPRTDNPRVGSIERGHKHDIEHTATGRKVTRRVDPAGISVGADDDKPADGEKRGRGRPKGPEKAPERVTGGATKHKGGRKMAKEGENESDEIKQAMAMLKKAGYTVEKSAEQVDEKAVSKKQQRFMGMVHAAQKGEKPASKEVAKTAKSMGKKDAEDFAATKHKGLPEKAKSDDAPKKKKEKTQEAGGTDTPTASSGFSYGKGIYDSINREIEEMIAESMSVTMSMNNDTMNGGPGKNLTVNATDEDAVKLASILKMAGMGGGESSCGCGQPGCDCAQQGMDEAYGDTDATQNDPDYPTETETSADPFQYSGGINKPKSTGQTTVPVIASQEDRQGTYAEAEEDAIKRMMEMAGVKKKEVDEEKTDEGNKFTGNLAKARADGKKEADLDGDGDLEKVKESIFDLTNQWRAYKG
jgi:hypothetical protein